MGTITSLRVFVMMVMMVVWVDVMVVVMILSGGLRLFVSALSVGRVSPFSFFEFVSRSSTIVATTQPRTGLASALMDIHLCTSPEVAPVQHSSGGTHACGCAGSIGRVSGVRCTADTRSQSGEHAAKLHLNPRIVAARTHVSGLCALHSLREWRVTSSPIQLWANIENAFAERALAFFAVLLPLQSLHSLVLFKCHGSFRESVPWSVISM